MKDFSIELATREDDPAIRRLLAENPVPGDVVVTYEREPDYFLGCNAMGRFWQVGVARHNPSGRIAGLACRSTRPMYVNGMREEVGYLSQLRVDRQFRGRWLVAFGMKFARELHGDGRVSGYITTIIANNDVARGILVERPRDHHPTYREIGRLDTIAIILRRPRPAEPSPYVIERGSPDCLEEIVDFLNAEGRRKQFFPAYEVADFQAGTTTPGFDLNDFFLARRNGKLVGVAALWDQSAYKQTVVRRYSRGLRFGRPFYNAISRIAGGQPLPAIGEAVHYVYASFICTEGNRPEVFAAILRRLYNEAAARGYAYLLVGLDSRDPLLAAAKSYPHISYPSNLFTVCFDEAGEFHAKLDGRLPHIEIATL